jgi:hypothetical protein
MSALKTHRESGMNKHFEKEVRNLSDEMLVRYADLLSYSWWNLQGNWMQLISTKHGTELAAEYDTAVWDKNSKVQAWKLKALFNFDGSMEHFVRAISLSTVFSNTEFEFPERTQKRVRLLVTKCTMQLNRLKGNLPELPCKVPGIAAVAGFAAAYNPKVKTTCISCPPDEHSDNEWCHWLFELQD